MEYLMNISPGNNKRLRKAYIDWEPALNNTKPPNTATATDNGSPQDNRRGLGAFLEDMKTH